MGLRTTKNSKIKSIYHSLHWIPAVLQNEISLLTSYRFDFWMNFFGKSLAPFLATFFLWHSLFAWHKTPTINGYTFEQMLFYSILAPLIFQISINDEFTGVMDDIYNGTLNRYLVLPLSYGLYKYISFMAKALLNLASSVLLIFCIDLFNFQNLSALINWPQVTIGIGVALAGCVLYFLMAAQLEMVSFWQDQVWNLIVGLRFIIYFSSGLVVPLTFYPEWLQKIILLTPFPYLVGIPVSIIFVPHPTKNSMNTFLNNQSIIVYFLWLFILIICFRWVWRRGKLQYTGVGI